MSSKRVLVTGGLGFIGSNLIATMEAAGGYEVIVADDFGHGLKWKNVANRSNIAEFIDIESELDYVANHLSDIDAIVHLGAISSTVETDVDSLIKNNLHLSEQLYKYAKSRSIPFIYASSASVYGGSDKFIDSDLSQDISVLRPLNAYGWSKKLVDYKISKTGGFEMSGHQVVGLRFFNVYGPNEYHKGSQASVIYHFFNQIKETGRVRLFKSTTPALQDGEQCRDFVSVADCAEVILWMLANPTVSGIFNVGTGVATSFNHVAERIFKELDMPAEIEYIDMPEQIARHYQNYTRSDNSKLRTAGYDKQFTSIDEGIHRYCTILRNNEIFI